MTANPASNPPVRTIPLPVPDLLLQQLEFFLASHGDEPMSAREHAEATGLEADYLEAVARVVEDMMRQDTPPAAVNAFLKPFLARM